MNVAVECMTCGMILFDFDREDIANSNYETSKSNHPASQPKETQQMTINRVTIDGVLSREPEIRYSENGLAITNLTIAVQTPPTHNPFLGGLDTTMFFDVLCYSDMAENVALSVSKGMHITITGQLMTRHDVIDDRVKSSTTIEATDVAVSLRSATAQVTQIRNRREM
jgi:single-strand DNA-binding protein